MLRAIVVISLLVMSNVSEANKVEHDKSMVQLSVNSFFRSIVSNKCQDAYKRLSHVEKNKIELTKFCLKSDSINKYSKLVRWYVSDIKIRGDTAIAYIEILEPHYLYQQMWEQLMQRNDLLDEKKDYASLVNKMLNSTIQAEAYQKKINKYKLELKKEHGRWSINNLSQYYNSLDSIWTNYIKLNEEIEPYLIKLYKSSVDDINKTKIKLEKHVFKLNSLLDQMFSDQYIWFLWPYRNSIIGGIVFKKKELENQLVRLRKE